MKGNLHEHRSEEDGIFTLVSWSASSPRPFSTLPEIMSDNDHIPSASDLLHARAVSARHFRLGPSCEEERK